MNEIRTAYQIPEVNFYLVKNLVERLNKRAAKLGQPKISLEVKGEEIRKVGQFKEIMVKYLFIEMNGERPGLNGWEFVASLEHEEAGNIVRTVPGWEANLPEAYRTSGPACDHCRTNRHRKDTYIVFNAELEEFKQIGSNCLKDFTGHPSPQSVAAALEFWTELDETARNAEDYYEDGGYPKSARYFQLVDFLAASVAIVRENGWVSRSKAFGLTRPTADIAADVMYDGKQKTGIFPTQEDEALAAAAIEWANNSLAAKVDAGTASDFDWNMFMVASKEAITARQFGFAAYIPVMYKKAMEAEIARKAEKEASNWIGQEGKRTEIGPMTVVKTVSTETQWGWSYMNKFIDANGNVVIWWTGTEYELGKVYQGAASIKKHDEYNGIKQTQITRAKLVEVE